jgi:hypothetical protein
LTICETTVADNELLYDINHVGIASEIDAQLQNVDQTLEALRDKSRYIDEANEGKNRNRRGGRNETIKLRAKVNETLSNQLAFFHESTTQFPCLNSWIHTDHDSFFDDIPFTARERIFSPTRPRDF